VIDVAIVKTSYTKKGSAGKANIRYIEHRPGKDKAKITRTLWGVDGKMERVEAYQMIEEAPHGSYFYRLIMNPDPLKEDTQRDIYLQSVTEKTMRGLEDRLGESVQWVAATHADHSPLRHVHILAVLPRKLDRNDLTQLRDMATGAALDQRRQRDTILEQEKGKGKQWERERERSK
jgi:hypothetical protein